MTRVLRRRQLVSAIALGASMFTTALGLAILAAILWTLVMKGLGGWSLGVFTQSTPAPQSEGGLLNAIFGSADLGVLSRMVLLKT